MLCTLGKGWYQEWGKDAFVTYMLLKSEFVFLDFSKPKLLFCLDYLALMWVGAFIAHYGAKTLKTLADNKKRGMKNA